jgi:23S rRNA-/tRNA-specific pseudouridylate synthase
MIQAAYAAQETDGILQLAASTENDKLSAEQLWQAVGQAVNHKKGPAASILNAWIASCADGQAAYAQQLFDVAISDSANTADFTVTPDIVTYSLLYAAWLPTHKDTAAVVLDKAVRASKKAAGSKRRRAMVRGRNAATTTSSFQQAETLIQDLLGKDDFCVLYENDDLVVVHKPAGVSCFHKQATTAGKVGRRRKNNADTATKDVSLEDALLQSKTTSMLSTLNADARGLVHRLDRGTSGSMVLAKNDAMHAVLVADFFRRRIHKTYTCLVVPAPALNEDSSSGVMDTPVHGRPAKSKYKVLERFQKDDGLTAALLQVETVTGRKHQVRVHCAQGLGSPILGDDMYGSDSISSNNNNNKTDDHFYLHASSLSLPCLGGTIEASLPSWWTPVLEHWRLP